MRIDGELFFSFWSIISIIFLKLGFNVVDRTDLSTSVPPAVMFLFKHAFAISVIHSSDYRLVNFRLVKDQDDLYHLMLGGSILLPLEMNLMGFPNSMVLPFFVLQGFFMFVLIIDNCGFCIGVDYLVKLTLIAYGDGWKFISLLVLLISCYTSDIWTSVSEENESYNRLPMAQNVNPGLVLTGKKNWIWVHFGARIVRSVMFQGENPSIWRRMFRKRRKLVEFAFGMVGTILFQYFFRLKSFDHVLAFLYLAVAWLGNIALLGSSGDFGVLNFLLGNVIVGCTVNQFGLQGTTWIAYGASVFLYGMRVKFEEYSEDVNQGKRYIVW